MLGVSSLVAGTASVALTAVSVCAVICLTRVVMIGGIGARDQITAVGSAGFLVLASIAATTSSLRGLRAIRTAPGA